jgi:hypothetical protein
MSIAYWLWKRSCFARPLSKSIPSGEISPVAGSFMSFQMPASPDSTWRAFNAPHHARASGVAKSGNTVLPGHTWPM